MMLSVYCTQFERRLSRKRPDWCDVSRQDRRNDRQQDSIFDAEASLYRSATICNSIAGT